MTTLSSILRWVLAAVGCVAFALGFATLALLSPWGWNHRGVCETNFESVEAALAPFDLLRAAPPGAIPLGSPGRSCDDHHAAVSRTYLPPNGSRAGVEAFYQCLAARHGWQPHPHDPECMVKEVDGTEVEFDVWFDPESTENTYTVTASTWPC
ncbi:hypothetical protein ACIBG7_20100 [Nonomuraea sp. NPDC050328]|uniref:hypothetical protein n=1 Tax=Nonomuraea sp. NPDC050328 TaxID=3364361 RepID=UPI00379ED98B